MNLKRFLTLSLMLLFPVQVFAGYNEACLNECFATGHDCYFCNYICYSDAPPKLYPYRNEPCELAYYFNNIY